MSTPRKNIKDLPQHTMQGKVTVVPKILDNRDGSKKVLLTIKAKNNKTVKFQGFIGKNLATMGKKSPYPLIKAGDNLKIVYKEDTRQFADGTMHKIKQIDTVTWIHDYDNQISAATNNAETTPVVSTPPVPEQPKVKIRPAINKAQPISIGSKVVDGKTHITMPVTTNTCINMNENEYIAYCREHPEAIYDTDF